MNKKMMFINICLLLAILVSCNVENKNNENKDESVLEKLDNSIAVSRYLEKRNTNDLPVKSWRYDSAGKIEEYCEYDSSNPDEIKVTVYDNDTKQKEKIGSQILKYGNNSITGKTELLEKKTFDIGGKELYKAVKTINGNEITYIEKEDGEVIINKKYDYNNQKQPVKETSYNGEGYDDLREELFYEYDGTKKTACITKSYYDIDDDNKDDVVKTFYTKYFYNISGKLYREEVFLLNNNSIKSSNQITAADIKDNCEVIEYELDNDGYVVKEHSVSDGKDQNYTVYTYGEYKGKKYKQNVAFYNNVETDNQLVGKEEYRYYDDNDSGDYFYEEIQYYCSEDFKNDENADITHVSRNKIKAIKGRNENVNR